MKTRILFLFILMGVGMLYAQKDILSQALDNRRVKEKLDQHARYDITVDLSKVDAKRRQILRTLVEASKYLDEIFLRQVYKDNPALRSALEKSKDPAAKDLLRLFKVNAGPFDRLEHNAPFIGNKKKPAGANFYPEDLTKEAFERYVQDHPGAREALMSSYTVIHRRRSGLVAIPYPQEYKPYLEPAARLLKEAGALADDPSLKRYLESRAAALLSNDYIQSDIDWIDLKDDVIDFVFGPYEVYEDDLMGLRASYEAVIMIKNPEESRKLDIYIKHLADLEKNLPLDEKYKPPKTGGSSPIIVVDDVHRAAEANAGYQAVAFTLPNDPKVRELKGTKKVMHKNVFAGRVNKVILPIAERLIEKDQVDLANADAMFNDVLMHELAHALGPDYVIGRPDKISVNVALKEIYSALEEAKADVTGLHSLNYFIDNGMLPREKRREQAVSYLASIFRTVRFGTTEAHGWSNIVIFNYMQEKGAFKYNPATQRYAVDFEKFDAETPRLAKILLTFEAAGDYDGAKKFFSERAAMDATLKAAMARLKDIPIDIEPVFHVKYE